MDFNELREFNDYLEQVEDTIFNLCENVDVKATEARVDAYRKENAAEIARLNKRNEEEDRRIAEATGNGEWAPRRMSMDGSDVGDTPSAAGGAGGFGGMFGHTPGTGGGGPPRPVMAVPKPTAIMPQSEVPSARQTSTLVVHSSSQLKRSERSLPCISTTGFLWSPHAP